MYLKLAWRNIWRNKKRSFIAIASVFYAVLLASFLMSIQMGTIQQMVTSVAGFYTGYIQVHQKGYWDEQTLDNSLQENDKLGNILRTNQDIIQAVPRLESFALACSENGTKGMMLTGIDPVKENSLSAINKKIIQGSYFTSDSEDAVILAQGLASYLKLKVNDTLVVLGQGYHGQSAAGKYPIKAIIKMASPDLNKNLAFLPLKQSQTLFSAQGRLTSYAIVIDNPDNVDKTVSYLNKQLDTASYEVLGWKDMMPELDQTIRGKMASNYIILGVLYLIVAFGIFGTVLMMTNERMYEFGVLTAIGMKRFRLALVTCFESLLMSFIGAIVGLLISMPLVLYFVHFPIPVPASLKATFEQYGIPPYVQAIFRPSYFITQAIVIFVIALVICLYPLTKISKLKPVEAMQGE